VLARHRDQQDVFVFGAKLAGDELTGLACAQDDNVVRPHGRAWYQEDLKIGSVRALFQREKIMGQAEVVSRPIRPLPEVLQEVMGAVERARAKGYPADLKLKDFRWQFDQVSAKMNQAVYNDQSDSIHSTCLETVAVLVEMLSRS
jgi:hypothetical protein